MAALVRLKSSGGIGFLDSLKYYFVVHLRRVVDWCTQGDGKQWVKLELVLLSSPLAALPRLAGLGPELDMVKSHPLLSPTWTTGQKIFRKFYAPLHSNSATQNHNFKYLMTD